MKFLGVFTKKRLAILIFGLAFLGGVCWFCLPFCWDLPDWRAKFCGVLLLDRNEQKIWHIPNESGYRSELISLAEIPKEFQDATLAAEDTRFYEHSGVDYYSIGRAIVENVSSNRRISGGSTITQQLIKISSGYPDRTYFEKFREMMLARRLENQASKIEILEAYFNQLDYGNLRKGPKLAAEFYFNRPLKSLSLAQIALLAGLPQSPTRLNPIKNPQKAIARRNWILDRMQSEFGYDSEQIRRAKGEPLELDLGEFQSKYPQLIQNLADQKFPEGKIKTSIDLTLQDEISKLIRSEVERNRGKNLTQAAVVVIHNPTGEVYALLGSAFPEDKNGGQYDMTHVLRSAGSTIKPFVYAKYFDFDAIYPGTIIADIPTEYTSADGIKAPTNYNGEYSGPVILRDALGSSLNIPAMRVLQKIGGPNVLGSILRSVGIAVEFRNEEEFGLGMAIGNLHVNLFDLTNAYASLSREGNYLPTKWDLSSGNKEFSKIELSPKSCFWVNDCLASRDARLFGFGYFTCFDFPFWCAVKTGTSSNYRDNWCVGFTSEFSVGVWCGNPEARPMKSISGITGAGPIFRAIMMRLHENRVVTVPVVPSQMQKVLIDSRTGRKFSQNQNVPKHCQVCVWIEKSQNIECDESLYLPDGRVKLDMAYEEWFTLKQNGKRELFVLDETKWEMDPPKIVSPPDGANYVLGDEFLGSGQILRLKSNLPSGAKFYSKTLKIIQTEQGELAVLVPGDHVIWVEHPDLRVSAQSIIHVKGQDLPEK